MPVLSTARVAGVPLDHLCHELQLPYEDNRLEKIADETRTAGIDIIDAKGATHFGIAAALSRIVRAILRDENALLTVSSLVPQSMEPGELPLSLPAIINRDAHLATWTNRRSYWFISTPLYFRSRLGGEFQYNNGARALTILPKSS